MIRFPREHIADSVTQRILAIAKRMTPKTVTEQGVQLDQALQQPVGDVAPLEGVENAIIGRALNL